MPTFALPGVIGWPLALLLAASTFVAGIALYRLIIWIEDSGRAVPIRAQLREGLWFHFKRMGLNAPYPVQEIIVQDPRQSAEKTFAKTLSALSQVDFIQALDATSLEALARKVHQAHYAPQEAIFRQGDSERQSRVPMPIAQEVGEDAASNELLGRIRAFFRLT